MGMPYCPRCDKAHPNCKCGGTEDLAKIMAGGKAGGLIKK